MTGTPDRKRTVSRKIKDHNDNINLLWRKRGRGIRIQTTGRSIGSGRQSVPVSSGNFINKDGDTVMGALGWNVNTIIISSDAIDIAVDDNIQLGRPLPTVLLHPESGTADDLVTINGAKFMQQELWVRGTNDTVTITVKNSGNIRTHDGADFAIVGKKYYKFIYDIADEKWVQATTLGTGGGSGLADPARQKRNIITPLTAPTETIIPWSTGSMFTVLLDRNVKLNFTTPPPTNDFQLTVIEFLQNGTGNFTVEFPTAVLGSPEVELTPNAFTTMAIYTYDNGTNYKFQNVTTTDPKLSKLIVDVDKNWNAKRITNVADPISAQDIVTRAYLEANSLQNPMTVPLQMGNNDITQVKNIDFDDPLSKMLGLQKIEYFQAGQTIESISGELKQSVADNQSHSFYAGVDEIARFQEITAGVFQLDMLGHKIKDSREHIFDNSVDAIISNIQAAIGYSPTTEGAMLYNVPDTKKHIFKVNNVDQMTLDDGNLIFRDGLQVIFNPDVVNAGVNVGLAVGDPSTTNNADVWYNQTLNKLRTKENGVNVDVVGGSGGGANQQLDNLGTTAINVSLIPADQRGKDLGSALKNFDSLWIDQIKFDTHVGSTLSGTSVTQVDSDSDNLRLNAQGTIKNIGFYINGIQKGFADNNGLGGWADVNTKALTLNIEVSPPAINGRVSSDGTDVRIHSGGALRNVTKFPEINKTQTWTSDQTFTADLLSDGLNNLGAIANPWNNIYSDNTLFCSNLKAFDTDTDINVFHDLDLQTGKTIDFTGTASEPVGGALGAISIKVNGVSRLVKFYST